MEVSLMSSLSFSLQVLSDPDKRKRYDYSGFSEFTDAGGGGPGQGNPFTTMRAEEIFRQFFGDFGPDIFGQDTRNSSQQVQLLKIRDRIHHPPPLPLSSFST